MTEENRMRAWIVERILPTGAIRLAGLPRPTVTGDQCLLQVEAAGVNFLDTLMIRGRYQVKPPLPFTPGIEVSGVVSEAGPESPYRIGDRLCAICDYGGFAEYAVVPRIGSQKLPAEISSRDAVALSIIYPTAHLALRHRARLQAGETVLVHAGAGGVGSAAIQLAKHWGARVIATAGGSDKTALCRQLGADIAIDYTAEPLLDALRRVLGSAGVDVVVDPVGGQVAVDSLRCLAWGGRLVIVGFAGGAIAELPTNRLLLKNAGALGVYWGEYRHHHPDLVDEIFSELFDLYRAGVVRPLIRDVFPLADAERALAALAARNTVGKVVLEP
jgi:NADPH:quinone reductase